MIRRVLVLVCLVVFGLGTLVGCSPAPGDKTPGDRAPGDEAPPSSTAA